MYRCLLLPFDLNKSVLGPRCKLCYSIWPIFLKSSQYYVVKISHFGYNSQINHQTCFFTLARIPFWKKFPLQLWFFCYFIWQIFYRLDILQQCLSSRFDRGTSFLIKNVKRFPHFQMDISCLFKFCHNRKIASVEKTAKCNASCQLTPAFGAITLYLKWGRRRSVISCSRSFGCFQDNTNM